MLFHIFGPFALVLHSAHTLYKRSLQLFIPPPAIMDSVHMLTLYLFPERPNVARPSTERRLSTHVQCLSDEPKRYLSCTLLQWCRRTASRPPDKHLHGALDDLRDRDAHLHLRLVLARPCLLRFRRCPGNDLLARSAPPGVAPGWLTTRSGAGGTSVARGGPSGMSLSRPACVCVQRRGPLIIHHGDDRVRTWGLHQDATAHCKERWWEGHNHMSKKQRDEQRVSAHERVVREGTMVCISSLSTLDVSSSSLSPFPLVFAVPQALP